MFWLAGCYYISDDDLAAAIESHKTPVAPLLLSGIEPRWGLTGGGEEVVLSGKGFDASTVVKFGAVEAEVTSVAKDQLYVVAPATEDEGVVDITVTRGEEQDRFDAGYTYWADGAGQVGLYGSSWLFQKRGGYWSGSVEDVANAYFRVIHPVPEIEYWKYWSSTLDTCEGNPSPGYEVVPYDLAGARTDLSASITAANNDAVIDMAWDPTYIGFYADFDPAVLLTTQSWRLDPLELDDGPTIQTPYFMETPAAWEVSAPKIDGFAQTDAVMGEDLHVTWSNPGGTTVLLQLGLIKADGSDFESELFCAVNDDGAFDVPATFTTGWAAGRDVHLLVGRFIAARGTLDWNGSANSAVFVDWRYGALRSK